MSEMTAREQRQRTNDTLKTLVRQTFVGLGLIIGACGFPLGPAVDVNAQPEIQLF